MKLVVKNAEDLTEDQFNQINRASLREFQTALPSREILTGRLFFLLLLGKEVLAIGQLLPIEPVHYNHASFSILGIGGIIAKEKGRGYGKQIMIAIRNYLIAKDKTGVGFCMPRNREFYEKCGLDVDTASVQRFVYRKGNNEITDQEGQFIFYHDASDHFMSKVISSSDKKVILPTPPTW